MQLPWCPPYLNKCKSGGKWCVHGNAWVEIIQGSGLNPAKLSVPGIPIAHGSRAPPIGAHLPASTPSIPLLIEHPRTLHCEGCTEPKTSGGCELRCCEQCISARLRGPARQVTARLAMNTSFVLPKKKNLFKVCHEGSEGRLVRCCRCSCRRVAALVSSPAPVMIHECRGRGSKRRSARRSALVPGLV